ncbi:putative Beta-lactamase domain protein [uncultured Desulfatiglans sp.]|uniref:Putative Beta-lactamase domain protein n=1 Tax=Uncultured Desulfatiglans sp. TaxID=1748965 RepID=A0A653A2A5_UNCDX|nr:putative Beta-lactamase domain protein [uncultured Desulfatiglans sp.]
MMDIILLGTGTALPLSDRASPAIAVREAGHLFCLDLGPGTLRQMARAGLPLTALRGVFLTHFHPDHCADLVPLLFALRNPSFAAFRTRMVLAGPFGLVDMLSHLEAAYAGSALGSHEYVSVREIRPENDGVLAIGSLEISTACTRHSGQGISYRLRSSDGKILVYSGDTDYCDEIVHLAQDADILILECAFPDHSPVPGHLTPSSAARIAEQSGARHLVLTHFYPECLKTDIAGECRRAYSGELTLGSDLLLLRL